MTKNTGSEGLVRILWVVLAGLTASCGLAERFDRGLNEVYEPIWTPDVTPGQRDLHQSMFIVDLHADTLLWDRDLLEESDFGHVDLPRLIEGNVALQVFAIVTHAPFKAPSPQDAQLINSEADLDPNEPCTDGPDCDPVAHREELERRLREARQCISRDNLSPTGSLQVAQFREIPQWFDLRARAFNQIQSLKQFVDESRERNLADPTQPYLMLIEDAEDLARLVEARQEDRNEGRPPRVVGALLAVEGAHWIGGNGMAVDAGVEELFEAGVRMLAPTHRFDNALGASSEGCSQLGGLTEDGLRFLDVAEDLGMVLDLAHASDLGVREGAETRRGPVVISHTGVRSLLPARILGS